MVLVGGRRRTVNLPCGKIFIAPQGRLGTNLRLHKKVCETCCDYITPSYIYDMCNSEPVFINHTNFSGGMSCCNEGGKGLMFYTQSEDGKKILVESDIRHSAVESSIGFRKMIDKVGIDGVVEQSKSQKKRAQKKRAQARKEPEIQYPQNKI